MRAGFPLARLGAALACSLAAHAAAAWWVAGRLAPPATAAGGGGPLRAHLSTAASAASSKAPAPGPIRSARPAAAPKAPAAIPSAPRYYEAVELDVRPQIMTRVMPEYPEDVLTGTRGRVLLELYIGEGGQVDRARVALAEPAGKFETAALKAFAGARFSPGQKDRKAVASKLVIEITFGD